MPFYIGIGTKIEYNNQGYKLKSEKAIYARAYSKQRSKVCLGIINKSECEVEILYETDNKSLIEEKEREFISLYGNVYDKSGTLVNLTSGGVKFIPSRELLEQNKKSCFIHGSQFNNNKTLYLYDEDGNFIESYPTLTGFYKKYGYGDKNGCAISESIRKKTDFLGYFFSFCYFEKLDISQHEKTKFTRRPIVQYDKELNPLKIWGSAIEISEAFGVHSSTISSKIRKGNPYKNFTFKQVKIHEIKNIFNAIF